MRPLCGQRLQELIAMSRASEGSHTGQDRAGGSRCSARESYRCLMAWPMCPVGV